MAYKRFEGIFPVPTTLTKILSRYLITNQKHTAVVIPVLAEMSTTFLFCDHSDSHSIKAF